MLYAILITLLYISLIPTIYAGKVLIENSADVPFSITYVNKGEQQHSQRPMVLGPHTAWTKPIGKSTTYLTITATNKDEQENAKTYVIDQKKCMEGRTVTIELNDLIEHQNESEIVLKTKAQEYFRVTTKK